MSEAQDTGGKTRKSGTPKGIIAIMIVAIIAAIAGFALYAGARVPDGSAAKVNDSYVAEDDVSAYISQYRISHQLTDDDALAQALSSQNMSVAQFRLNAIDQLAITQLVNARAAELGVSADESQVDAHVAQMKSSFAFNDDSIWQRTLQQYGMTEDQVRTQYRNSLLQKAVCEKDVPRREASDAQALSYAKAQLAGMAQKHYTQLMFTGADAQEKAQGFKNELSRFLAAASFENAKGQAEAVKARARKAGANTSSYAWSLELDSGDELTQTLGDLELGGTTDIQDGQDGNSASIYLYDDEYAFPNSKSADSLKKSDVPASLWQAVKEKAADSLWNSDCSAYVAKLLAQAKVTYYPMPDGAGYDVDLSSAGSASDSSAYSSSSSSSNSDSGSESLADNAASGRTSSAS